MACIESRLASMFYLEDDHKSSLQLLRNSEPRFLYLLDVESQDIRNITTFLSDNHKRMALTMCKLKDLEAKRYVKMPRIIIDMSTLTLEEQLELKKKDLERIQNESSILAKGVTEQNNVHSYFSLCLIAYLENDQLLFCEMVEMLLKPNTPGFAEIPIFWYQKIISILIHFGEYRQALMSLSKLMLSHKEYILGWYVLFLLGIINDDETYIIGSIKNIQKYDPDYNLLAWMNYFKLSKKYEKFDIFKSKL